MSDKRILFCRSGGGLPGLDIHCGIWRALARAGIHATDCIGTSAGAVIGALDAAGYSANAACEILSNLSDEDVIHERFAWKERIMWIDYICEQDPIRKLLEDLLSGRPQAEPLQKNFTAVTNRVLDGARIDWKFLAESKLISEAPTSVNLIEAILASMAISGIFPWVKINDFDYTDGGTRANLPLPGNWEKYDEVWLLVATRPLDYRKAYNNVLARLLLNLDFYAMDQIRDVLDELVEITAAGGQAKTKIRVIWPDFYSTTSILHFDHALIEDAEKQTEKILQEYRYL